MKKLLTLLVICLTFFGVQSFASTIDAAGTTSTPNREGEVKVVTIDGVMYLSTETNGGQILVVQNSTAAATLSGRTSQFDIQAPSSYAQNFGLLLNFIMRLVLAIAVILVFAFLILGAFNWITSGGDKGKIEQARGKIVAAVIGLLIIASSYAILNLALGFLGFGNLTDAINNVGTIQSGPSPTPETDLSTLLNSTPSATPN